MELEQQVLDDVFNVLESSGLDSAAQAHILASILAANAQADGLTLNDFISFVATKAAILYAKEGSNNAK